MRPASIVTLLLIILIAVGCDGSSGEVKPTEPTVPEPDGQEYIEIRVVTVGPALAECYGVGRRTCMVVDGALFYASIEGFEYEAGYNYRLRIGKYDPWGGREPPQDADRYAYRLLELLEKTPARQR